MKFCKEKRRKNVSAIDMESSLQLLDIHNLQSYSPEGHPFLHCAQLRTDPKGNGRPESLAAVKGPSNGGSQITASWLVCPWRPPQDCTPVWGSLRLILFPPPLSGASGRHGLMACSTPSPYSSQTILTINALPFWFFLGICFPDTTN